MRIFTIFSIVYILISLWCAKEYFVTPIWTSFFRLAPLVLRKGLSWPRRSRLVRHLSSLFAYSIPGFFLLPVDVFIFCFRSWFYPPAAPVFICGTPRSGSTLLHRLLIRSSEDFYGLTHYEWRYPSVVLQLLSGLTGLKGYLSRQDYWSNSADSSVVSKMHPNVFGDFEEDAIVFEERCAHHPFQYLHMPEINCVEKFSTGLESGGWTTKSMRRRMLNFYQVILSSLSLLKLPASRFVSKEVASNERLHDLMRVFPDSRFIVITRQPSEYLSSLKPLLQLSTKTKTSSENYIHTEAWWKNWCTWLAFQAENVACFYEEMNDSGQVIHIDFNALVANPSREISKILKFTKSSPRWDFNTYFQQFEQKQSERTRGYVYNPAEYDSALFEHFNSIFYPSLTRKDESDPQLPSSTTL